MPQRARLPRSHPTQSPGLRWDAGAELVKTTALPVASHANHSSLGETVDGVAVRYEQNIAAVRKWFRRDRIEVLHVTGHVPFSAAKEFLRAVLNNGRRSNA